MEADDADTMSFLRDHGWRLESRPGDSSEPIWRVRKGKGWLILPQSKAVEHVRKYMARHKAKMEVR